MENRPAIPADVKRRVLVEAGHRCAIPTCRYIEVDIHHIVSWAQCQAHEYDNLIALCPNCHRRADKGEIDRKSLRIYKFNLRLAHDKFSNLEMDILFELRKLPAGRGLHWPPFNMLLIKRVIDAGYIRVHQPQDGGVFIGGMRSDPDLLTITQSGSKFLESLGMERD
ncbi:HNH endonuclease [Stappia indica]|uniref:HNH endonuclease n=1 Tax=Stappia indica TaxID=538381 RepID=UPI001CD5141A|nr:HNH endonuclease [Stappia indica]